MGTTTFRAKNRYLELSIPYLIMFKYPDKKLAWELSHSRNYCLPGGLKYNINGRKNDKSRLFGWVCIGTSNGRLESCQ